MLGLVAELPPVAVCGLLAAVASLVAGHGLWGRGLSGRSSRPLQSVSSVVTAHGLSCSEACEIFPDQGSNPGPLHWQVDSYPWHDQGSPQRHILV